MAACGAWSVATHSITPLRSASISAWRSDSARSGGFILKRLSVERTVSSVSVRWWGEASPETCAPWALASASACTDSTQERCWKWTRASSYRASAASRATIVDSDSDGIPAIPSRAETAPSCITPSPDSAGSSSCRAMIPPLSRWYCRALRSIPAEVTGLPSSVKPIAPTSRSSAISVSSSPRRPRVMLARKPVGTRACADASAISELTTDAVSTVGTVFGIATIAQ